MIRGLIFDFDGLMVDTEAPAYEAWQEIFREHGCELPLMHWSALLGGIGSDFDPCIYLEQQTGITIDHAAVRARRWQRKVELSAALPLLPGILEYLDTAQRLGLKLAVASGSGREWVAGHLERLLILDRFDAVLTADDVVRIKPDPALYLKALEALEIAPEEALVFEDSPNGLRAANRAGIFAIAIPNQLTGQLPLDHADMRLVSLADIPLEALLAKVQTVREATSEIRIVER